MSLLFEPFLYTRIISDIFILWVSRQRVEKPSTWIVCYKSISTRYKIPIDYCSSPMGVSSALSRNFMLNKSCTASGTLKLCWPPSSLHSNSHWPGSKGAKDKEGFQLTLTNKNCSKLGKTVAWKSNFTRSFEEGGREVVGKSISA